MPSPQGARMRPQGNSTANDTGKPAAEPTNRSLSVEPHSSFLLMVSCEDRGNFSTVPLGTATLPSKDLTKHADEVVEHTCVLFAPPTRGSFPFMARTHGTPTTGGMGDEQPKELTLQTLFVPPGHDVARGEQKLNALRVLQRARERQGSPPLTPMKAMTMVARATMTMRQSSGGGEGAGGSEGNQGCVVEQHWAGPGVGVGVESGEEDWPGGDPPTKDTAMGRLSRGPEDIGTHDTKVLRLDSLLADEAPESRLVRPRSASSAGSLTAGGSSVGSGGNSSIESGGGGTGPGPGPGPSPIEGLRVATGKGNRRLVTVVDLAKEQGVSLPSLLLPRSRLSVKVRMIGDLLVTTMLNPS
ncbi:unnamed protein product, partial [Discosporangium mesarthrocarpum]